MKNLVKTLKRLTRYKLLILLNLGPLEFFFGSVKLNQIARLFSYGIKT